MNLNVRLPGVGLTRVLERANTVVLNISKRSCPSLFLCGGLSGIPQELVSVRMSI